MGSDNETRPLRFCRQELSDSRKPTSRRYRSSIKTVEPLGFFAFPAARAVWLQQLRRVEKLVLSVVSLDYSAGRFSNERLLHCRFSGFRNSGDCSGAPS